MKPSNFKSELSLMAVPLAVTTHAPAGPTGISYIIGAVISVFILGYLIYSLLKPDKF